MKDRGMSQRDLAKSIGTTDSHLSNILNGNTATIPDSWEAILRTLDLVLIVVPRKDALK